MGADSDTVRVSRIQPDLSALYLEYTRYMTVILVDNREKAEYNILKIPNERRGKT